MKYNKFSRKQRNNKLYKCYLSENAIEDMLGMRYKLDIQDQYIYFQKNKRYDIKPLTRDLINNLNYFPFLQDNKSYIIYNSLLNKVQLQYLINLYSKDSNKNIILTNNKIPLILGNIRHNIKHQGGGFKSIFFKDPMYNFVFKSWWRSCKIVLYFTPMDAKFKKGLTAMLNLLNGNNPLGQGIKFTLSNEFIFNIQMISTRAFINMIQLISNNMVPLGAAIEGVSTGLDATGVGAVVGVAGNIVGAAAELLPTLTMLLKQGLAAFEYMMKIFNLNKSIGKLNSLMSGGNRKKKTVKKKIKKIKLSTKHFVGGGGPDKEIIGIPMLIQQFFQLVDGIPPFKMNDTFLAHLEDFKYQFPSSTDKQDKQYITIIKSIDNMINYVDPIIQNFADNPKNANDMKELCELSDEMIKNILGVISSLITTILQQDAGVVGTTLELLVTKCRPDKIYEVIKQCLRIIPEIIVKILIQPQLMEDWIDLYIKTLIGFLNDNPEKFIHLMRDNFPCMDIQLLNQINGMFYGFMLDVWRNIFISNIKNRFEPFLKESILTLYLIIPFLLIFANINSKCMIMKNQDLDESSENLNQDQSEGNIPPFQSMPNMIKQWKKTQFSKTTIPLWSASCQEISKKYTNDESPDKPSTEEKSNAAST